MQISRNTVAGAAAALILVQNALFLLALSIAENIIHQGVWLVVNTAEVIVFLTAAKMLAATNRNIAALLVVIALYLLAAFVSENFFYSFGEGFWIFTSSVLISGLILCALYLFEK